MSKKVSGSLLYNPTIVDALRIGAVKLRVNSSSKHLGALKGE